MKQVKTITAWLLAITMSFGILYTPALAAESSLKSTKTAATYISQAFQQSGNTIVVPKEYLIDATGRWTAIEMATQAYQEAFRQSASMFAADKVMVQDYGHEIVMSRTPLIDSQEEKAMTRATAAVAKKILSEIIRPGMDEMQKASAIFAYISENTEYDMNTYHAVLSGNWKSDPDAIASMNAYGCLVSRKAVCSGYVQAFNLLAREAGLSSTAKTGAIGGISHAWNQVLINNHWYTVDCTLEMFFASEAEYFSMVALRII